MKRLLLCGLLALLPPSTRAAEDSADAKFRTIADIEFAQAGGQRLLLDLHLPKGTETPPLVVWIHGGGWRGGSRKKMHLDQLIGHGHAIASISYRFTDKAIFPAQIHDCKAAIRWLRANAKKYGYNADWIAVAGSSAGGHLALLVGVSGDVKQLEGTVGGNLEQSSRIQSIIDYYGPSDFVLRGKSQPERAYTEKSGSFALLGGKLKGKVIPELEVQASPAQHVTTDDPPLLVFQGAKDKVVLPDQSERIVALYQQAHLPAKLVVLKNAGHGGRAFYTGEHLQTAVHFLMQYGPSN